MEVTGKEGKYMYCIIESSQPRPSLESAKALKEERGQSQVFGPLGIGERNDEVYTVCFRDIAAVVSNSPIISYSVSRENMLAHEKVIEEVMKEYTVLPVRFCTITENEEKIKKILEKEYDKFKDLLKNMMDKKELGLKAIFKENIYEDILKKYEDIRISKQKIEAFPPERTVYQRMEIGKMVAEALEKEKENYKQEILNGLSPLSEDTKINNNYGERMIISVAFLIDKDKEALFDQKVQELGANYGSKINFKYVGTVPPFNFVNLVIDTSTLLSSNGERPSTLPPVNNILRQTKVSLKPTKQRGGKRSRSIKTEDSNVLN